MSERTASWLAWSLLALFLALAGGLVLLGFLNRSSGVGGVAIGELGVTSFSTVGALVAARRPRNPMGWIILAIAVSFTGSNFAYQYALYALINAPGALPGGLVMAWLSTWVGLPGTILLLTFFFLLFPTGHLPSPRWRAIALLVGATLVIGPLAAAFTPGNTSWAGSPFRNPLGIEGAGPFLEWFNAILRLSGNALGALCAASTVLRFRRAHGDERQQLKWFAYALVVIVVFFVLNLALVLDSSLKSALTESVGDILFGLVISLPAIAIGIAILRHRLYDIDLLIRRTLIYGSLTTLMALVYWGSVLLLQTLLRPILGEGNDLAIVVSTLLIAALFLPLRRVIQTAIDRRFYRRKYDAAKTLAAFSATLRDEVDLDVLTARLLEVVEETVQPANVLLWLRVPNEGLK